VQSGGAKSGVWFVGAVVVRSRQLMPRAGRPGGDRELRDARRSGAAGDGRRSQTRKVRPSLHPNDRMPGSSFTFL